MLKICSFSKFGYCKFGGKCRKSHYSEVCEIKYCENVNFCEKRHPRMCYYLCAYGFCKFGSDCQFRHENHQARNHKGIDFKQDEENKDLKKELVELNLKHEGLKIHLDNMMESQSKQEACNKYIVAKEIEKFKEEFVHILKDKNEIIKSQTSQLAKLS